MNLKAWEQELAAVMPFVLEARRDLHWHPRWAEKNNGPGPTWKKRCRTWGFPPSALRAPAG